MRKNRVQVLLFFFIIISLILPNYINKSKADVMPAESTGTGNFIPAEDCSLIMTNASVILNIDYVKSSNKIYLSFSGNYTIYNPNESVRMTLVAPFSDDFKNLESTCLIKSEGNVIPFNFRESDLDGNLWEEFFDWRWTRSRKLLVIDMDFPENDSIEFEYIFDAYLNTDDYQNSVLDIYYDVGTSRAWNGTITERVEFNVYGKHPDSYANNTYEYYNFTISDIEDGQIYVWEWKNDVINADSVYISYSYTSYWRYMFGKLFIILFYPVGFLFIIIIIVIVRRRAKRKT